MTSLPPPGWPPPAPPLFTQQQSPATRRATRRPRPWWIAAAAIVVGVIAALWIIRQPEPDEKQSPNPLAELYPVPVAATGGVETLTPPTAQAVESLRGATGSCESLIAAVDANGVTTDEFLSDNEQTDAEILALISELQLSVSLAYANCAGGQKVAADVHLVDIEAVLGAIDLRNDEIHR